MDKDKIVQHLLRLVASSVLFFSVVACEVSDRTESELNAGETTEAVEEGAEEAQQTVNLSTSSGEVMNANDGVAGFLWKPRSERDGRLVVLLPNSYRGNVSSVSLHSGYPTNNGNLLEQGTFAGDDHNGDRPHFRFSQSGGGYGNDVYVRANLNSGGSVHWHVPSGAGRHD